MTGKLLLGASVHGRVTYLGRLEALRHESKSAAVLGTAQVRHRRPIYGAVLACLWWRQDEQCLLGIYRPKF